MLGAVSSPRCGGYSASLFVILVSILLSAQGIANFRTFSYTYIKRVGFPTRALPTSSGYLSANASCDCRMFYAYYEARVPRSGNVSQTPIILWLQGGPGASGMTGNLYELGPWRVAEDLSLNWNPGAWNHRYGVLFVDNPIGTGFSVAESEDAIPTDQRGVVLHLHAAMSDFFSRHPDFAVRPFFVAGESYGGKYVPALGHHLMRILEARGAGEERPSLDDGQTLDSRGDVNSEALGLEAPLDVSPSGFPFRLDGLMIGNGLTDPRTQVRVHGDTGYQFGIISWDQKIQADRMADEAVALVDSEDWLAAHTARTNLVNWIQNVSGLATLLDVRRKVCYHCDKHGTEYLAKFLNTPQVKQALNADMNLTWVARSQRVIKAMKNDTMKSTKGLVDQLLNKLPILLYQGQYDAKDGVASSEEWMKSLHWVSKNNFFSAARNRWYVDGELAGYIRNLENLSHVVLLDAGHEVPADVAKFSQNMVESWIESQLS